MAYRVGPQVGRYKEGTRKTRTEEPPKPGLCVEKTDMDQGWNAEQPRRIPGRLKAGDVVGVNYLRTFAPCKAYEPGHNRQPASRAARARVDHRDVHGSDVTRPQLAGQFAVGTDDGERPIARSI